MGPIKNFKVSVVLPSYNESENIAEAIERISKSLGKSLCEIIVVDDDSPDKTWEIVQNMHNPKYKVIRRMNERGLASALARGVEETKGNIVVWMDCDLGLPPEHIPYLIDKLNEYDVAVGSRYVKGGKDLRKPRARALLSIITNLFAGIVLGFHVRDYTSGFIAVRRSVFDKVKLSKEGFGEYFIEFIYECTKKKMKIIEVGYVFKNRTHGISKSDGNVLTLLKYGFDYGWKVIKLRLGL